MGGRYTFETGLNVCGFCGFRGRLFFIYQYDTPKVIAIRPDPWMREARLNIVMRIHRAQSHAVAICRLEASLRHIGENQRATAAAAAVNRLAAMHLVVPLRGQTVSGATADIGKSPLAAHRHA